MAIWQDLVADYGFLGGYQSVKRFVRKVGGAQSPEARAVIVTAPGEEAQVDFGTGPVVRDPLSGKCRRTRLFVMTLGCSRKSVRLLVFRSSARIWAELRAGNSRLKVRFLPPSPFKITDLARFRILRICPPWRKTLGRPSQIREDANIRPIPLD